MKKKHQLENPNNARVFIDYQNKKEPIKFEYVGTDNMFKIIYFPLLLIWLKIQLFLFVVIGIVLLLGLFLSGTFSELNEQEEFDFDFNQLALPILVYDYLLMIPALVTILFIKNKKLLKLMPYINNIGGVSYTAKFIPKDVKDNKIEIPLFKNVALDYKATEDFSKYLQKFKIVEHPFNMYLKKKRKPQQYLWKAVWVFSEEIKSGELNVKFK